MVEECPNEANKIQDVDTWIDSQNFQSTADIKIPDKLADQVIGQDSAVEVVKKAAEQKRHVMLIGEPGTGKSMLARAMTEYLPKSELQDVIAYHNPEDSNEPRVRIVPAGKGKDIVNAQKKEAMQRKSQRTSMVTAIVLMVVVLTIMLYLSTEPRDPTIILIGIVAAAMIFFAMRYTGTKQESYMIPKLLVSHDDTTTAPFIDATAPTQVRCWGTSGTTLSRAEGWRPRRMSVWRSAPSTRPARECCSSMRST